MRGLVLVIAVGIASVGSAAPSSPESAEARRLYEHGTKLYNLSMWRGALEEFQKAYLIRSDPALLFNIGQCQRQLGDMPGAMNSYRAYLRESKNLSVAQRDQVQTLLDQLEQQSRTAKPVEPTAPLKAEPTPLRESPPKAEAPVPATAEPIVVAAPQKKPLHKRWFLWVGVGAVVAVGLGVGLGVGLTASRVRYPSVNNPVATLEF